ncbi:SDR family NAD(P)-dependent oxidoreductase [Mycolicibacterium poriferae]|uniref:SDR family NAD(P)-dependent oxidoreductase n=1 Tax=Mycolicibacterium poriferae TaxID=39694 RepID=UPI00321A6A68
MADWVKGRTVLVTAAAQGIGRATALAFAAAGARVVATDINEVALGDLGNGIATRRLDVLDTDDVGRAVAEAGSVDVLFNGAGFVHSGSILEMKDEDFDFAIDLNVRSMIRTIRAVLPGMLERGDRRLGRGGVDAVADHGQGRFQIRRTRPQRQSTEFGVLDGLRNTFHQKLQHVVGQPRDIGQQRHRNSPPVESALGRLLSVHGRDFNAPVAECRRATPDDVVGAASSTIIGVLMSVE